MSVVARKYDSSYARFDGYLALVAISLVVVLTGTSVDLVAGAISRNALHLTQSSQPDTTEWWVGFFLGSILPLQSVLLGSVAGHLLQMAGSSWWRSKSKGSRPSTLVLPEQTGQAEASDSPTPAPVTAELILAETAVAPPVALVECAPQANLDQPTPHREVLATAACDFGVARLLFSGDRVTLRVNGNLSNRRWKELHQQLRRVSNIAWDDAQKLKSEEAGRQRMLTGVISAPNLKGKKSARDFRENSRRRHADLVRNKVRELVAKFDT